MIGELNQGRYLTEAELGRGGMGVVYQARDTLLDRPVAIKVVSADMLEGEAQKRLLREARAAARLNHPNIVTVYDVGEEQLAGQTLASSYIVMELVEGASLRDFQPDSLDEAVAVGRQIAAALDHAHQRGIVHRDLKPENILLASTPGEHPPFSAKLMDFGLARATGRSRLTQPGALIGTLSHMAPEVILGQEAGPEADLYALGVMLYELAAGRPPFEGGTPTAVLSQHLHAPVVPPSAFNAQIPPLLDDLIVRLLEKEPAARLSPASEAVRLLEMTEATGGATSTDVDALQLKRLVRGRLIGRESEFSIAAAVWERAAAGEGHVLLVSGEPGIGKTRLVQELATHADIFGATVLTGNCYERGAVPFMPISQIVRSALANYPTSQLSGDVVAGLASLAPDAAPPGVDATWSSEQDPEIAFVRRMESIVGLVRSMTTPSDTKDQPDGRSGKPLLLFVDDLQWADSGTLAVIRHLTRHLESCPILIVGAYREAELERSRALQELLADLQRERLATRVKLHRLEKEQAERLLETLFAEEVTADFLDAIYQETEGNPFFIEEICKALIESGELTFKDGRWQRPEMERLRLPQSVRTAIQPRISMLDEEEQEVLALAALIGREFPYDMLRAVCDCPETELIAALELAERLELIQELRPAAEPPAKGPRFSFTHALIHSNLLSGLSTLRRRQMQRTVAEKLEAAYPGRNDLDPLLGRYFAEAHDSEKAVTYLLRTGDRARELHAFDEAAAAYNQALLFLKEDGDWARTARTLMKLAMVYHNSFAFKEARLTFEDAFAARQRADYQQMESPIHNEPAPHPLRLNFASPVTLDTAYAFDAFSETIIKQLFSGLLQLNVEGEIVPDVAASWELLDGGNRYFFRLREDVRWTDGRPVTAYDFEMAWKRVLGGPAGDPPATLFYDIKGARAFNEQRASADSVGVKARSDHELEVVMEGPSSYFLELLSHSTASPVPVHVVRDHGDAWTASENLVTNGPFTLIGWEKGKSLTLERNTVYHGAFGGNIERVEIHFDSATSENLVDKYDADELDVYYPNFAVASAYGWARRKHATEYISLPAPGTFYLGFNVARPPFDDWRVRRALALSLDRESLADQNLNGVNFPATGGFSPPGIFGHVPSDGPRYDPLAARMLMIEAGYPGGQGFPKVTLLTGDGHDFSPYLVAMSDQLEENLGIKIGMERVPYAEMLHRLRADKPDMWFLSWIADYRDADSFMRTSDWQEIGGWINDDFRELVERGRRTLNHDERLALYEQAEQLLTEKAPIVPLIYNRFHILLKPWVARFPASPKDVTMWKEVLLRQH